MENIPKKHGKVLSFVPLAAYALWSVVFLIVTNGHIVLTSVADHFQWLLTVLLNNAGLLWSFVMCAILAFTVLVYYIIHIARVKTMGAGDKIAWIMFMACLGPLAFPVFYYFELRKEADYIEVHPNIA